MKHKTCVSVAEKTPNRMNQIIKKALQRSDYVEIRFDFLKPSQIPAVLEESRKFLKRSVCTLRPKFEGGKFSGKESERVAILKLIAEYKPFLIDIEYSTLKKNKPLLNYVKKTKTPILVSWHDFKKTPCITDLQKKMTQMKKISNNVKIVTTAKTVKDASKVLSLYSISEKVSLIAFAMGGLGRISRVLCLYLGSPYTYVSLGKAVAPGQFSIDEIKSIVSTSKS